MSEESVEADGPVESGSSSGPEGAAETPSVASPSATASEPLWRGMGVVLDVPVRLTVEVGRAEMLVREVLQLTEGSVVELDRGVGEPADLYVNGRRVARGDLIVVDERVAIRITEMGSIDGAAKAD
ncbi:MAG: flagellar motor switch protein FliN [Myxococcota bacterium]